MCVEKCQSATGSPVPRGQEIVPDCKPRPEVVVYEHRPSGKHRAEIRFAVDSFSPIPAREANARSERYLAALGSFAKRRCCLRRLFSQSPSSSPPWKLDQRPLVAAKFGGWRLTVCCCEANDSSRRGATRFPVPGPVPLPVMKFVPWPLLRE